MIYGIGTDIVSVERVGAVFERYGERFARKILSDAELLDMARAPSAVRFLAKRFAAKEAFSKAIGTGIRRPVTWRFISVGHDRRGKPLIDPHPLLAALMHERGIATHHISITDERDIAVAFVVLEAH